MSCSKHANYIYAVILKLTFIEDYGPLECESMLFGRYVPKFERNQLSPALE